MTAIDFSQATAPAAMNATKGGEFSCGACADCFATSLEHRAHFKSERHVYNTKRKQAGLKPISQEAWERKLKENRNGGAGTKGTAHLKAKEPKPSRKSSEADSQLTPAAGEAAAGEEAPEAPAVEQAPLTPRNCLFDRQHFESVELNLAYMEKTYSFFVPDQEYCTSIPDLLNHLHAKIGEEFACINCNRRFPDAQSARRHMLDKGHTQLASEAHTRRGKYDEAGTEEMQEELEPFYDFQSSFQEVANKINDPAQKVASILRFFDENKDKRLNQGEVAALWAAANDGAKLSDAQYAGACAMAGVEPKDGLDTDGLAKLYKGGFADLNEHFAVLQDALINRRKKLTAVTEEDEDEDEDGEDADGEESEEEDEDGDDIVECEDEDEFEEVMRVLGLKKVEILETGDMRLPNGTIATHRDVGYIYRQRGVRMDQVAIAEHGTRKMQKHGQLMLSNRVTSGCVAIALSHRQEARQGKRIVAVLKEQNKQIMRMGLQQNIINNSKRKTIRTGRGDMSNGR